MPVMLGPASCPSRPPTVAKAASYRPIAMPTPMIVQPRYQTARLGVKASTAWPTAITTMLASKAPRPPCRSIHLPTRGAHAPATSSAQENAPRMRNPDWPKVAATGPATIAGR